MTDYLHLLKLHDDPENAVSPPGFDRRAAAGQFMRLADAVMTLFPGATLETGKSIQDASFHGQVRLVLGSGCREHALVRASNFGGFVAIHDENRSLAREERDSLLALFAEHGYTFIPEKALAQSYTSSQPVLQGVADWWERYFEWPP